MWWKEVPARRFHWEADVCKRSLLQIFHVTIWQPKGGYKFFMVFLKVYPITEFLLGQQGEYIEASLGMKAL